LQQIVLVLFRILDRKEDGVQKYRQERKGNQRLVERVLFTKAKSKKCGHKQLNINVCVVWWKSERFPGVYLI